MDPIRKIPKKVTKKFVNKVINRQYFHRKTGLESGKSGNFTEILDLGSDRTIVFLRGSQLIRSFSMQQTLHWV